MIRSLCFAPDGGVRQDLSSEEIAAALSACSGLLWVDMVAEPVPSSRAVLSELFHFHPLAVDDALAESHAPKLDDWGQYLYLVLHAPVLDHDGGEHVDTLELDLFVGKNYVVLHHDQPIQALEQVWVSYARDERHGRQGVEHLLYEISDALVAGYMPVIEEIDDAIDQVETAVFDQPTQQLAERIFHLKRSLLHLRRIIAPQREVLNRLARDDYAVIDPRSRIYFRDVYDHFVRMYDISENLRDLASGTLDIYLSAVNNRMNEIMKTLTIITTLFMPLSFVVGFFGQNFFHPVADLGAWTSLPAFLATLVVIALTPVAMYLWMRRRAWM